MNTAQLFKKHFPHLSFEFDYPLATKSYFKIGGKAEVFYLAKQRQEAIDLLLFCKKQQLKFTILGGASNVVIADQGLSGLVLILDFREFKILKENEQQLLFQADVGLKTAQLVAKTTSHNASGLEGFIGVPGNLGGAIYNNAHYLSYLIADYISEVEVFDLNTEQIVVFSREKCEFAYEQSIFQRNRNLLIFSAKFALKKDSPEVIKANIQAAREKRETSQPLNLPSCGCVFQNPLNTEHLKKIFPQFATLKFMPAGFLIEQAGLKGTKAGDIQVSDKHAAFFVNLGSGTAEDFKKLVSKVKTTVLEKFGVMLKEEVFYLI